MNFVEHFANLLLSNGTVHFTEDNTDALPYPLIWIQTLTFSLIQSSQITT